jgi:hypothetical protein
MENCIPDTLQLLQMASHAVWTHQYTHCIPAVHQVFSNLLNVTIMCYLDNILVYLEDLADHLEHI